VKEPFYISQNKNSNLENIIVIYNAEKEFNLEYAAAQTITT
jgi:hypothetical protein